MNQNEKVIPMNPKTRTALFTPELRTQLEAGAKTFTDKPTELVTHMEQIACTWLVSKVRTWAAKAGEAIGKVIAGE